MLQTLNLASRVRVPIGSRYNVFMVNSNEYMREYMKQYSAKRKAKVLELLGGKCNICESVIDLEVDHTDESNKLFTLASGWHHSWTKILEEIKKCQLLCKSCHKQKHSSKHPCGTAQRYWRGCRCLDCTAANTKHNGEYRKG